MNYFDTNNIEIPELNDEEMKSLLAFVSERSDEMLPAPWKISALISEVIEFVRNNDRSEKW